MTELQGDEFYGKATKVLNDNCWFFGPRKSEKYTMAINNYLSAANQYIMAKCYAKASAAYVSAANLYLEKNENYYAASAASTFVKASESSSKINDDENTIKLLETAIKIYLNNGDFINAGKNTKIMAEMAEEKNQILEAITLYEKTCEYCGIDKVTYEVAKTLLKIAYLSIDCSNYTKAIDALNKVCDFYMKADVGFNCTKYFLEIGIIQLYLGDIVACKKDLARYIQTKPDFIKTKEYLLLNDTITACEKFDYDMFSDVVTCYDDYKKLNHWQVKLLLEIKEKMYNAGDEDDFT